MKNMQHTELRFDAVPDTIDLLILDGSDYTTYPEWQKLKDRTDIVILDDAALRKCAKIRQEVIDSKDYDILADDLADRHGYTIARKK